MMQYQFFTWLALFFLTTEIAYSVENYDELRLRKIERHTLQQEHTARFPTDFAGEIIVDRNELAKLEGKKIHQIDLIYTQFKRSVDFDQIALNKARIDQLKALMPRLTEENPTWTLVEQTGAKTAPEAERYYHGFIIHYGSALDYQDLNSFFEGKQKQFTVFKVNNQEGAQFDYESGSRIIAPKLAVKHPNGSDVQGEYEIYYREFRDPAEIMLSGIPMTFNDGADEFIFSSAGMYEIKAYKNGQELKVNKAIEVKFEATDKLPDVGFFEMDEAGHWDVLQSEVRWNNPNRRNWKGGENSMGRFSKFSSRKFDFMRYNRKKWRGEKPFLAFKKYKIDFEVKDTYTKVKMNKHAWRNFLELAKEDPVRVDSMVHYVRYNNKMTAKVRNEYLEKFLEVAMDGRLNDFVGEDKNRLDWALGKQTAGADLSGLEIMTSPNIVQGLKSDNFGVYNCDQVGRMSEPMALQPVYHDSKTGAPIEEKKVVCIVDSRINASLSFHPNNIRYDKESESTILLFTEKDEIFLMSKKDFAALDKSSENLRLNMLNISNKVDSPKDLRRFINS